MNGWYLIFIVTLVVNYVLILTQTECTGGDALYWFWGLLPCLAWSAGCKWRDRNKEY